MGKRAHHFLLKTGFKLILLIACTVAVLLVNAAPPLLALFILSFIGLLFSGASKETLFTLFKASIAIIVFIVVAHIIVCDGSGTIALIGPLGLFLPGITTASLAILRVLTLMCALFCLTSSLTTAQIVLLVRSIAQTLKGAGSRLDAFGRVLSLLILFFPLCMTQLQSIHEAQQLRGSSLFRASLRARIGSLAETFVALLVLLFQKADKRALALRSRGF